MTTDVPHNTNHSFDPSSDLSSEVSRLAEIPPLNYDQLRKAEADRLGVQVSTLDREVRKARLARSQGHDGRGRRLHIDTTEPWDEPVDGGELLDGLVREIRRYLA